ncbi:hypothetical protein J3R03_003991 [Actinoplanes couchii]|nr:hypothetical protein [Actinoplanes couchii]
MADRSHEAMQRLREPFVTAPHRSDGGVTGLTGI